MQLNSKFQYSPPSLHCRNTSTQGVLAHRRLVGIVHGAEIVAPHKEIDIEVLARMCRHKAVSGGKEIVFPSCNNLWPAKVLRCRVSGLFRRPR